MYFVSHGGEAFPSLIVVLQGDGVRVDLTGSTFISKAGITSSTFKTVPDVPVSTFELYLPEGKFSALAANGNLCTSTARDADRIRRPERRRHPRVDEDQRHQLPEGEEGDEEEENQAQNQGEEGQSGQPRLREDTLMSARKTTRRPALLTTAVLVSLVATLGMCAAADAFMGYAPAGSFGGGGQFKEPAGVAVNDTSKEVYVYDSGNLRVERFSANGAKFEGQFNGSASPTGQFAAPGSVSEHAAHGTLFNLAVDNDPSSLSKGDVYVVDPGHNVIDKFSAVGVYLSQLAGFKAPVFGVAVDTAGNVWVAEEGSEVGENHGPVQEFDDGVVNKHVTELDPEALRSPGITVDSEQNLYLFRGEPNIIKVNKEGATLFGEGLTSCGCGKALAFDTTAGKLFFDEGSAIAVYPGSAEPGTPPIETLTGLSSSYGVAVNDTSHALYASQREADTVALFQLRGAPRRHDWRGERSPQDDRDADRGSRPRRAAGHLVRVRIRPNRNLRADSRLRTDGRLR